MSNNFGCVVNPTAGQEYRMPLKTTSGVSHLKRMIIAGGGPAGLEAARSMALRGHAVTLYESRGSLGGQVAIAASAPHRADIGAVTRWLSDEVHRLGVKVHLRTTLEPDAVIESGASVLVLATGSTPRRDGFQTVNPAFPLPGHDLAHVTRAGMSSGSVVEWTSARTETCS